MRIRNLPYSKLNKIEKEMVQEWYKICLRGTCKDSPRCKKNIQSFWKHHREPDTEFGKYDGWTFEDKLKDMVVNKIQNENCQ